MNIKQMIDALAYVKNDAIIRNAGTEFCSYRGYYEHLAICEIGDITVQWLKQGTAFRINEYDGSEDVEIIGQSSFYVA